MSRLAHRRDGGPRERLLGAAVTLMRRTGLTGAGINEIARESGAPKGSIYHYFPGGKEQIAVEALDGYAAAVSGFIDASLRGRKSPGRKVEALFAAFAERVESGRYESSCAAGAVCLDLDGEDARLRESVASALQRYVDAIARHFACNDPRRSRSFAGLLLSAIEGAYIRSRAERSSAAFREAGAWLAAVARREFH